MSMSTFQATNQPTTEKEQLRARLKKSLLINGRPADTATINRMLNGTPAPTDVKGTLATSRPFSLLR